MKRPGIIIAFALLFAAVVILLLVLVTKPDSKSLRFVAGRPSAIGTYSRIGYDWPSIVPFG
jgi:hypothetical protein